MPKWKSPIFSDIRNAIGDNVVFSQWKGRPFFRSYVIPANPNTGGQQAVRLNNTAILKRFQDICPVGENRTAWNASALAWLISGCNLFMKWGRKSWIYAVPTSGPKTLNVTLHYKCGIPLSRAAIYQFVGAAWTEVTIPDGIQTSGTVSLALTPEGDYYFFIADKGTVVGDDSGPQVYQAITKWYPDTDPESEHYGENIECMVHVTAT